MRLLLNILLLITPISLIAENITPCTKVNQKEYQDYLKTNAYGVDEKKESLMRKKFYSCIKSNQVCIYGTTTETTRKYKTISVNLNSWTSEFLKSKIIIENTYNTTKPNTKMNHELLFAAIQIPKTPKSKAGFKPFLNWLHSRPNMFPLLQKLL